MDKKQTAMQQLLNQLREERNRLSIDFEWNRCFQAIESVIESKYIPIEKDQIIDAIICFDNTERNQKQIKKEAEYYYTSTYE
jgi:hypothetical protein